MFSQIKVILDCLVLLLERLFVNHLITKEKRKEKIIWPPSRPYNQFIRSEVGTLTIKRKNTNT